MDLAFDRFYAHELPAFISKINVNGTSIFVRPFRTVILAVTHRLNGFDSTGQLGEHWTPWDRERHNPLKYLIFSSALLSRAASGLLHLGLVRSTGFLPAWKTKRRRRSSFSFLFFHILYSRGNITLFLWLRKVLFSFENKIISFDLSESRFANLFSKDIFYVCFNNALGQCCKQGSWRASINKRLTLI